MSYLDRLRTPNETANFLETPGSPSVESVETPSKPSIDTLDTPPSGTFQKINLPDQRIPRQPRPPRSPAMSYLDMLRTLDEEGDSSETPKSPSVESVETPSKPSTDTLDTSPSGDFQKAALPDGGYSCPPPLIDADHEDIPHRLWLVSTGAETRSVSFCPPVALSEVMKLYPGAQVAPAPEPDPNPPLLPPETEATINAWLDHIGERHAEDRADLLANCARDPAGLTNLLGIIAEAGISAASPSPEPAPEPVTCGTCEAFERDRIGDGSGLGACRINAPASRRPPARWPNTEHLCRDWRPSE